MSKMEVKTLSQLVFWSLLIALASADPAAKLRGRHYLNNYITAIEDNSTEPTGFMVTTADTNYAIFSPRFQKAGWLSVTVNEGQVFIVSNSSSSLYKRTLELDEDERDLIAEVRANFSQSLTNLKLSRAVASDSLLLLSNKLSYAKSAYGKPVRYDNFKLSQAEQAIHLIEAVKQLDDDQEAPAKESSSRRLEGSGARKLAQTARGLNSGYTWSRDSSSAKSQEESYQSSGSDYCSRKSAPPFSYYNLLGSSLNDSLGGDVYNFDFHCNILDVYSSSVSIKQSAGLSVLYRDENFFAYSRSDLPKHINRFFLLNDKIFFVYQDRSLLLKHDWLLDPLELEVVIGTRRQLRDESEWRATAAAALAAQTSDADREDERDTSEQATGNGESKSADSDGGAPAKDKQ